jgi:hypothetical protein
MLTDDDLAELYRERGVPTPNWVDITPDVMGDAFRMYFRALKSPGGETDLVEGERGEGEDLIHDPVRYLRTQKVNGKPIIGEDETPHISTMVLNHEKTLNRFVMYVTIVASTNPSIVGIIIAKEEEPG